MDQRPTRNAERREQPGRGTRLGSGERFWRSRLGAYQRSSVRSRLGARKRSTVRSRLGTYEYERRSASAEFGAQSSFRTGE